jgi:hypothetical protein
VVQAMASAAPSAPSSPCCRFDRGETRGRASGREDAHGGGSLERLPGVAVVIAGVATSVAAVDAHSDAAQSTAAASRGLAPGRRRILASFPGQGRRHLLLTSSRARGRRHRLLASSPQRGLATAASRELLVSSPRGPPPTPPHVPRRGPPPPPPRLVPAPGAGRRRLPRAGRNGRATMTGTSRKTWAGNGS